ncbi:uncharacterized protein N7483_013211 [Penicillium malachiteum]|uniref:uncharacterized protein n=1 Tax=Penicillium malachiteum TaxID=1324776 RepID=UPI0025465EA2|nr:uncharacterized protein N7483_013211 [Penicillium malachiteum]KAJ5716030.1 hypothetical protein N7483_013211 [Penicillium malachiteum]
MIFRNIYLFFFLAFNLSLAEFIKVYQDKTLPTNTKTGKPSIYIWTSIAIFDTFLSPGKVVSVAEDGYESMLKGAYESEDEEIIARVPLVITAIAYSNPEKTNTIVYLASSAKGTGSLIYEVTKRTESKKNPCKGVLWDTVPDTVSNALNACKKEVKRKGAQHQFDAKCGEIQCNVGGYCQPQRRSNMERWLLENCDVAGQTQ